MGGHVYTITVEPADAAGGERLEFQAESHDDILALARKVGRDDPRRLRLLVGLKLLGGVLLEDKGNPLYQDFLPQFGRFMQRLKAAIKPS